MKVNACMTHLVLIVGVGGFVGVSHADLTAWLSQAENTPGNVTASDNGGAGWTFDGTGGVVYNYEILDSTDTPDGSTIEFIFNFSNNGPSIVIGTCVGWGGWGGPEMNALKLNQWYDLDVFGLTNEGHSDHIFSGGVTSLYDQLVHAALVRENDAGTMNLYVNGTFAGTITDKTNWWMEGGVGMLGSKSDGDDAADGIMYGVASYNTALTATQVAGLYSAIPEPSSAVLMIAAGGAGLWVRRRLRR